MRKKIFWVAVCTMLMAGIYLAARQQPKSKPGPTAPVKAAASFPSIMAVRMHVHDDGSDVASETDHCIKYDPKPDPGQSPTPTPTPLKVEVDLSEDPQQDLTMMISMFYSNPNTPHGLELASEPLRGTCMYDSQHPMTCTAAFYEITNSHWHNRRAKLVPPWHLGDYPDGTYFADGSLSTTMAATGSPRQTQRLANSSKAPGLPGGDFLYVFRNPSDCSAPPLSKQKSK